MNELQLAEAVAEQKVNAALAARCVDMFGDDAA